MILPEGWSSATLDTLLVQIVGGGTPSKANTVFFRGTVPFMTVKDMKDRFPTDTIDHISNDAVKASATSVVPADTLIVATRISLGRIARPRFETAINQDLKALFLAEGIDKTFVEHWWRWRSGHIQSLGTGTTVKGIRLEDVRSLKIDVPPAGEQKRLADKLDAILTRVDACRERLDNVPVILKRFRQALLAAATSGKLTEEWRAEQGKSEEWPTVRLTDVGEIGRGKSKHRPRNDPRLYGGPYPFIQTGDVAQSGGRITTHSQTYSEFGIAQSKLWPAGTVCITIAANIADTAILEYPACFPDSVVGFVADPTKSLPEFIKWSIDVISERLEAFAPATAQKNINLAVLNDVEFRCPPLDEQHEIVRRVEALFAYADRLEARYTTASDHIDRLTPALLAKAFRGELVPQDPNDEPASALLERIRAARAAAEEVATPKQRKGSRHKTSRKTEVLMLTRRDIQNAHLTTILKERGPLTAEALWSASQLDIDDFYDQLKDEEARGFLREKRGDSSNALRMVEAA